MTHSRFPAAILALAAVVGCDRSAPPTATVRGRVLAAGKPVTAGSLLFEADRPKWGTVAMIAADGSYTVADVPPGPVRVGVRTRGVRRFDKPDGDAVAVPKRYEDSATSGLVYEVGSGEQTIDIVLMAE